ncbi:MAG: hypothetical protein A2W85_13230 [Bacteroidetes bacterium GWF2_41_31]|nr:MAG: hypothetical protein A2W85_13230 [Bacteroidetes bacterium GWF2_41_31]OFZ02287.1 MAG: hypothetical protein A2338_04905 [Bacteroidetes bacterium RIFOXYB12_FULL_41_6]
MTKYGINIIMHINQLSSVWIGFLVSMASRAGEYVFGKRRSLHSIQIITLINRIRPHYFRQGSVFLVTLYDGIISAAAIKEKEYA